MNYLPNLKQTILNSIHSKVKVGVAAGVWNEDTLENIAILTNSDFNDILEFLNRENYLNSNFQISSNKFSCFLTHGLHPMHIHEKWLNTDGNENIKQITKDFELFNTILKNHLSNIWAIGEAGFDLSKDVMQDTKCKGLAKKQILELQNIAYEYLVECAVKYNLPLILHLRAPWQYCYERIQWALGKGVQKIMIHCYSGSVEELKKLSKHSIFFSFGGVPTWKHALKNREAFIQCPAHLRLLETDSPDLPPELPELGKLPYNEPAMLSNIANILAKYVDLSPNELIDQTNKNILKFLGII